MKKALKNISILILLTCNCALAEIGNEKIVCGIAASVKYDIPANIFMAIVEKEGGKPWQVVKNKNGTVDIGPMQFNTVYLKELEKYGIEPKDVAASGCYPYDVAAWRVKNHLKNDSGDIWTRAANYHSRNKNVNSIYRKDLILKAVKWADWIDENRKNIHLVVSNDIKK